jgi:hypothetical protein
MSGMNKGVVVVSDKVAFTDTAAKYLFSLPNKAIPLSFTVQVDVAFNDTGTDLLNIGTATDPDHFAAAVVVSATGAVHVPSLVSGALDGRTGIYATYVGQNSNATAGRAQIHAVYASPFKVS